MAETRASKHPHWDGNFWEPLSEGNSRETTFCPKKDRLTFELKSEEMIRSAIPKELGVLQSMFQRCNWTQLPENACSSLHDALVAALYNEEDLDSCETMCQLYGIAEMKPNGQIKPRPTIVLPFPVQYLDDFIRELKHQAFRTVWRVRQKHSDYLKALPRKVEWKLFGELLPIALREVLDRVSFPSTSPVSDAAQMLSGESSVTTKSRSRLMLYQGGDA